MKIIECPYWIVTNDEELKKVTDKIGEPNIGIICKFPFIIGRDGDRFIFQKQNTQDTMENFVDDEADETYKYIKQQPI